MTFVERFGVHLIAYGPVVLLVMLAARGRKIEPVWWIASLGFLVSAPADLASLMLSGDATWAPTHFYPLPQLGLFAWALSSGLVVFSWSALMLAWATSLALTPLTEPEWVMALTGVLLFVGLAVKERRNPLAMPLAVYAVLGGLVYLGLAMRWRDYAAFLPWWYAYQASRLAAFALFGRAVWRA